MHEVSCGRDGCLHPTPQHHTTPHPNQPCTCARSAPTQHPPTQHVRPSCTHRAPSPLQRPPAPPAPPTCLSSSCRMLTGSGKRNASIESCGCGGGEGGQLICAVEAGGGRVAVRQQAAAHQSSLPPGRRPHTHMFMLPLTLNAVHLPEHRKPVGTDGPTPAAPPRLMHSFI